MYPQPINVQGEALRDRIDCIQYADCSQLAKMSVTVSHN